MPNIYDKAILDWGESKKNASHKEKTVQEVRFDYWLGCYSSWTCDYDMEAVIFFTDGTSQTTSIRWDKALEELPEYVDKREQMEREHNASHGWDQE